MPVDGNGLLWGDVVAPIVLLEMPGDVDAQEDGESHEQHAEIAQLALIAERDE